MQIKGNGEKAGIGADIIRKGWEDNKCRSLNYRKGDIPTRFR